MWHNLFCALVIALLQAGYDTRGDTNVESHSDAQRVLMLLIGAAFVLKGRHAASERAHGSH